MNLAALSPAASPAAALEAARLQRLPLVTLYLTERCNSRCVTCDYWRYGADDLSLQGLQQLLPELRRLHTEVALFSGGEPLLNPAWEPMAQLLRAAGLRLWLLTSGLSLAKHAARAATLFGSITVSLDGTNRATYQAIRGLDAFENVCAGVRAAAAHGVPVGFRVTLQRANYRELPRFVELAHECNARQISFLAVDVANPHAFARKDPRALHLALQAEDLDPLQQLLQQLEHDHAADFRSGFIAESPQKLRRLHQYFAAVLGRAPYPAVRCNAPEVSAVVDAHGQLHPCFFIAGPTQAAALTSGLDAALNSAPMTALRAQIRAGQRPECATCVCPLWRTPGRPLGLLPGAAGDPHV